MPIWLGTVLVLLGSGLFVSKQCNIAVRLPADLQIVYLQSQAALGMDGSPISYCNAECNCVACSRGGNAGIITFKLFLDCVKACTVV